MALRMYAIHRYSEVNRISVKEMLQIYTQPDEQELKDEMMVNIKQHPDTERI